MAGENADLMVASGVCGENADLVAASDGRTSHVELDPIPLIWNTEAGNRMPSIRWCLDTLSMVSRH